jgi:hypothetical protein
MHIHHQQQLLLDATTTIDGCSSCQQLQHQQHKEMVNSCNSSSTHSNANLKNSHLDKQTVEQCSLFLPPRWGAGPMALMLWLDWLE